MHIDDSFRFKVFSILFLFLSSPIYAQVSDKLTPPAGNDFDYFGEAVAISGDYAIVGSWLNDNENGEDAGTARIYFRSGNEWIEQAVLLANDGEAGDQFGFSVAINGDEAFVGAHRDDNSNGPFAGAVYVFARNGAIWAQQTKLLANDGAFDDQFGIAVASRGSRLIVGAAGANEGLGGAYIYHKDGGNWGFVNKVQGSDSVEGDGFGRSVDIDSDHAIVGAATSDQGGDTDSGVAYVYTFNGSLWEGQTRLTSSQPATEGLFGRAVSLSGGHAIVGAPGESVDSNESAGAAYVFVRDASVWSEQARLNGFEPVSGDEFGFSVSMVGEYAVVGARWHRNNQDAKAGAAYLYKRSVDVWSSEARLQAIDGEVGDQFGNAVGFSNERVIAGARWDDTGNGKDAGSAYIFPVGSIGQPSVLPSVEMLDYGAQSVGESVALTLSVTNVGTANLNIGNIQLDGADAEHFRIASGGGFIILEPLMSEDVTIEFSPRSPGDKTASVRIESNEPSSPRLVSLTGTGAEGLQPGVAKVLASRGSVGSSLGSTVAVTGNMAIVGAEGQSASESGGAYVYERIEGDWVQQQRIVATGGAAGDRFGSAVDMGPTHAIVGAWNDNNGQGAAYIYVKNGADWVQQARLTASDGSNDAQFGRSVAIEGNTAIVGAWQDNNDRGQAAGAAYIYTLSGGNWQQSAKIVPADVQQGDRFGSAVSVSGSSVLVGAANGGFFGEGAAYVYLNNAGTWTEDVKLVSPSAGLSDGFGSSVAMEGSVAVVGAPLQDDASSIDEGAVYGFIKSGGAWSSGVKLTASNGSSGFEFGSSVDIVDTEIVIGAKGANNQKGAVYVFARAGDTWNEALNIETDGGEDGDAFGSAVSFTGFDILVGAPENSNVNGSSAGAAYVFNRNGATWTEQAQLLALNSLLQPRFGSAVAIDGTLAVIGAAGTSTGPGAAYVYQRTDETWRQIAELSASDGAAGDRFGASAAIDGEYIAIGAPSDDNERGADAGTVYIFFREGESWSQQARLVAQNGAQNDQFGNSVALSGDLVVLGSPAKNSERGAAFVFARSGTAWSEQSQLTASDGVDGDRFGESVTIQGTTIAVGSPNEGLLESGAIYVFEQTESNWNEIAKLFASDAEAGDGLGGAVDIDGVNLLAGAEHRSGDAGAAYLFQSSGGVWGTSEVDRLQGEESVAGDLFGYSVSLSGPFALVGSLGADGERGASYLYQLDGATWLQQSRMTPLDDGGSDRFGFAVGLDGEYAVIGALDDDNGNGEQAGSAYIVSLTGSVTVVNAEDPADFSEGFSLDQNYPNPFAGTTTIPYSLSTPQTVRLEVYDVLGRRVATLVDRHQPAGSYEVAFDASGLSNGVYFYRMEAGGSQGVRRFVVLK